MQYILSMFFPSPTPAWSYPSPCLLIFMFFQWFFLLLTNFKNDGFSLVSWSGIKFIHQVPFSVHRFKHSWGIIFLFITVLQCYWCERHVLFWHDGNRLSLVSKFFWPDPSMCETSLPDPTRSHRVTLCISDSNPEVISPSALVPFCGIKHTQDVSDSHCSKEMCLGICTERYICPPFCLSSICVTISIICLLHSYVPLPHLCL